jgi:hypothetical protein
MPGRWPSSPAHTLSSCGLLTRWVIGTVGLTLLWMRQQQRPAQGAGPLTRPRRQRLAVVRWLLLDNCTLWRYTVFVKNAIASTLFLLLLLALRLMLWSGEKKPLTGLVTRWGAFLRLGPSVGCGARAHSGPCPYWFIWLAVLCQGPQSGPAGARPWHQIAGQIPRRSGRIFAPQPPAKRAKAPLAGP